MKARKKAKRSAELGSSSRHYLRRSRRRQGKLFSKRTIVERAKHHDTVHNGSCSVTYQSELVNCGKPACKACRGGYGHGPYWYAYWTECGSTKSLYIGKKLRPAGEVLAERQQRKEAAK